MWLLFLSLPFVLSRFLCLSAQDRSPIIDLFVSSTRQIRNEDKEDGEEGERKGDLVPVRREEVIRNELKGPEKKAKGKEVQSKGKEVRRERERRKERECG